jgi:hypothetical protein
LRASLAERLLATVMEWSPEDIAQERPLLDVLARLKYDEYQQFSPGMRFIESLAYWLSQFDQLAERQTAYEFFRYRLIFCSTAEMNHLVSLAYADHIRPHLLRKVAEEIGLSPWHLPKAMTRTEFKVLERQTLFLGLSDGARTDVFRRMNPNLSTEQVRQSHELAHDRVGKLLGKLRKALGEILGTEPRDSQCLFRSLVLLDDFSASGFSYLRKEKELWEGKIGTFLTNLLTKENSTSSLVDPRDLDLHIVLYMATDQALKSIGEKLTEICSGTGIRSIVSVVYAIGEHVKLIKGNNGAFDAVLDTYYDSDNETESTWLGGTDLRYGFNACGLPLILSHNTPNNSIGLLWANGSKMRPLFPRVTRHKDRL